MKKIVITGGMGFIFSHVTEYFIRKGYDVHVIDNLSAGSHPELVQEFKDLSLVSLGKFTFIECDVSFAMVIPIIKTISPEYIVHAAAMSDVDYSIKQPVKTILSNNNATTNIFDAARDCKNLEKLLYVSTDEVYGECAHPKTEEEILFPKNPYALSKAFGSLLRLAYDNTYGHLKDRTCETRFCNVFGERQDARKFIPAIKTALQTGRPLKLHNNGEGYRQFIHVSEIPPLIDLLLKKGHRTYNVTADEGFTMNELILLAEKIVERPVPTIPGKRSGMDMRYEMSSDRLAAEFDWKPSKPFIHHFEKYICS